MRALPMLVPVLVLALVLVPLPAAAADGDLDVDGFQPPYGMTATAWGQLTAAGGLVGPDGAAVQLATHNGIDMFWRRSEGWTASLVRGRESGGSRGGAWVRLPIATGGSAASKNPSVATRAPRTLRLRPANLRPPPQRSSQHHRLGTT